MTLELLISIIGICLVIIQGIYWLYKKLKARHETTPIIFYQDIFLGSFANKKYNLHLFYKDTEINQCYLTRFIFWYRGHATINRSDISEKAPIKLSLNNGVILQHEILGQNNPEANLDYIISDDRKELNVIFDYLTHNNGFVFDILHSGNQNGFILEGTLKIENGKMTTKNNLFTQLNVFKSGYSDFRNKLIAALIGMKNGKRKSILPSLIFTIFYQLCSFAMSGILIYLSIDNFIKYGLEVPGFLFAFFALAFMFVEFYPSKNKYPKSLMQFFYKEQ